METNTLNQIEDRGVAQHFFPAIEGTVAYLNNMEDELLPLSAQDEEVRSTLFLIDLLRNLAEQEELLREQLPHVPDATVRRHLADALGAISSVIGKTRELLFKRTKKLESRRAVA